MSNYLVETFYTCTFKIVHKLDELNENKLSELENRKDGRVEIIDVKLNNRKPKAINEKSSDSKLDNLFLFLSFIKPSEAKDRASSQVASLKYSCKFEKFILGCKSFFLSFILIKGFFNLSG